MAKLAKDEREVLQCVYDLQLDGRMYAYCLEQSFRDLNLRPTKMTYDPVPFCAIIGDLWRPDLECVKNGVGGLDRVLRRLEVRNAVEHDISNTFVRKSHVRPDGKVIKLSKSLEEGMTYCRVLVDDNLLLEHITHQPYREADRDAAAELREPWQHRIDVYGITNMGVELLFDGADGRSANQTPPPLTGNEQRVLNIILQQPKGSGILGKEICSQLRKDGFDLDFGTLRGAIIANLKKWHRIGNRKGVGYYVKDV